MSEDIYGLDRSQPWPPLSDDESARLRVEMDEARARLLAAIDRQNRRDYGLPDRSGDAAG